MYGSARGRQILQYKISPNPNPNPNTNPSSPYCIMRFIFGSRVHVPLCAQARPNYGCKMDKMAALCVAVADNFKQDGNRMQRKQTLQPLPQARIQVSAEGITPTNLPPRSRISQDPKRSSLQRLDSQVKRCAKRARLQRHLPLSIRNSAVPPLNFANILLVLLQSTSTHRALATFIVH